MLPDLGVGFWPFVSMGAILGGTMRSPFTGVVFLVELTHDVNMLLPLLIAVTIAHAFTVLVLKRSILTEKIARRGRHILQEYTVDALEFLQAGQLMTKDPATLPGSMSIADTVKFFKGEAEHRSYPVVDDSGRLLGLVSRTDALRWQLDAEAEGQLADALSDASASVAFPDTPCGEVADLMVDSGIGRVPIVDHQTRRVVGIISRQDLLKVRTAQKRSEKVRPAQANR